jgi:hypothetical protein
VNVLTCSNTVFSVIILLLIGTCHLNVNALDFSEDISIPDCFVVMCTVRIAPCKLYYGSDDPLLILIVHT